MNDRIANHCPILVSLLEARLIGYGDYYMARSICEVAGETHSWPKLALALTSRGLASGLVCIEPTDALLRIREAYREAYLEAYQDTTGLLSSMSLGKAVEARPEEWPRSSIGSTLVAPDALPWPDPQDWIEVVVTSDLVRNEAEDAKVSPLVWSGGYIYLDRYYRYQSRLAEDLRSRVRSSVRTFGTANVSPSLFRVDVEAVKPEFDRQFPMPRNLADGAKSIDRQRLAAAMAILGRLTVITGGPGTGKTTIAAKILHLLLFASSTNNAHRPTKIALAAPTGKAAMRLQESLQDSLKSLETSSADESTAELAFELSARTLHRLLRPMSESGTSFYWNRDNPLPYDVVIVDEASMVSLAMMSHLLGAVSPEARLILLGDKDQLASVEAGAVLGDLSLGSVHAAPRFSSHFCERLSAILSPSEVQGIEEVGSRAFKSSSKESLIGSSIGASLNSSGIGDCVVALNRFYRFAEGSTIGQLARSMTEISDDSTKGREEQIDKIMDSLGQGSIQLLEPAEEKLDAMVLNHISVGYRSYLQALRRLQKGARDFEGDCRAVLEAFSEFQVLCAHRRGPFGVESVNRQIEEGLFRGESRWKSFDRWCWYMGRPILITENNYELELYNGDIGIILPEKPRSSKNVAMFFDPQGQLRSLALARLPACETVFAMSIHKSQGSQFDHVTVCLPSQSSNILSRELIYTAVTRARKQVTLVAKRDILVHALRNKVRRPSGLRRLLWGEE